MMHTRSGLPIAVLLVSTIAQATQAQATQAQIESPAVLNKRVDLVLEKKDGAAARPMDPAHVFAEGDLIRFRLRSGVNGFLYVMNRGSSGKYEQLFPKSGENTDRSVKAGRAYVIPDPSTGWFRVQSPAGYETVYFLISPLDFGKSLPLAKAPPSAETGPTESANEQHEAADAFATATPRCDDELFRARGECLDQSGGLKPLRPGETLPGTLSQIPASVTSRDLVIVKGSNDTQVSSTEPFDGPVVYQFRIAHK
jgi:hypothetical protein